LPNLRRMYYDEAPGKYEENIPLSIAVTASAGVPGIFKPIEFDNLYRDNIKLSLVDGGVHDNQGLSTLYEQECNRIIVSDASGQMSEDPRPKSNAISASLRTNSILQERIRYSQFRDLDARKKSGVVRDYLLMHFTKGLSGKVISWQQCDDPYIRPDTEDENRNDEDSTNYNIRIGIQKLLAKIRTDLDAFHHTEAAALMYSGYSMTAREIETASSEVFRMPTPQPGEAKIDFNKKWDFLSIQKIHDSDDLISELERKLIPSSKLFGKSFDLSALGIWWKIWGKSLIGLIAVCLVIYFNEPIWTKVTTIDYKGWFDRIFTIRHAKCLGLFLLSIPVFALLMRGINVVSNYFYERLGGLPRDEE